MNEESSSGGRVPSSIKPPTAQDTEWGATSLGAAPRSIMPVSPPSPSVGAMPQYAAAPPLASAPPRRQQNLWLWIVGALVLLGLLVVVLGVVVLPWLR